MDLIIAAHCHQPLGNFDEVAAEACDNAYLPFLDVLRAHPSIRVDLHYSGSLLEWLESHRPDVIERLTDLASQIEWMGGALYEPILPLIPEPDARIQIERHRALVQERFGQTPRGIWLAERVWDPHLVPMLRTAGVEYVPVDDYPFVLAGYPPDTLTTSFVADHLGASVRVFPILQDLRYAVPALEPEEVIELLRQRDDGHDDSVAVLADDGEKFGLWPGTSTRVYAPGNWLDRFLTLVEETDWITTTTFERHLDEHPPRRRVALPPGSYREMAEWSLPVSTSRSARASEGDWEQMEAFLRGGWWPNFLVEYPEANVLYRKMLRLSLHVNSGKEPQEARNAILKAQGNDPYWHGAFGGLYFPHLRAEVQRHLIDAQVLVDGAYHRGRGWAYLRHLDWDGDGRDEIRVELPDQSWVLDPAEGGCLLYRDDKPTRWSTADVVSRRLQAYHAGLDEAPIHDPHPRRWLVDHLLAGDVTPSRFHDCDYSELLDLPFAAYTVTEAAEERGSAVVHLSAASGRLAKRIEAEDRSMKVSYHLEQLPPGRFGPELPIATSSGALRVDGGPWQGIADPLELAGHRFRFRDDGRKANVVISLRQPGHLFSIPLHSLTRSNGSFATIMQGVVLWPHWTTNGRGSYEMTIEIGDTGEEPA